MSRFGKTNFIPESVKTERAVLTKLLRTYKNNECLWNTCDQDYNNKVRKKEAQEKLVKIYRKIEPNADMTDVRKKLDNMRSSGKRYFKKKLEAKTKGKSYSSSLWYYNQIKFLYGDTDDDDSDIEDDVTLLDEEETKLTKDTPNEYASEYIEFLNDNYEANSSNSFVVDSSVASPSGLSNNSTERKSNINISEGATTIDQQLSEVDPEQKDLAENLILRIVYLARMNKLTPQTDISLKSAD